MLEMYYRNKCINGETLFTSHTNFVIHCVYKYVYIIIIIKHILKFRNWFICVTFEICGTIRA